MRFESVAADANVNYVGPSWGAAWGDFNSDGWPDLWLSNHSGGASLHVNDRVGGFVDGSGVISLRTGDTHGAAWADFDNDGDQDLLMLVGSNQGRGSGSNQLFVNAGGVLLDSALEYGLDYPFGRGRTPSWFDYDADGRLDVFLGNTFSARAPPVLFGQNASGFIDKTEPWGLAITHSSYYAQLVPVLPDQRMSLVAVSSISSNYPGSVWETDVVPAEEISEALGLDALTGFNLTHDTAIADLDGDLDMDIFAVRQGNNAVASLASEREIRAVLARSGSGELGFAFTGGGELEFNVQPGWFISSSQIHIGELGVHPPLMRFTVSAVDAEGTFAHTAGAEVGLFISHDAGTGEWTVTLSTDSSIRVHVLVQSDQPVTGLRTIGFTNGKTGALTDRVLLQDSNGFSQPAGGLGISNTTPCRKVVAADFDNDMDVDLYLACHGPALNLPNRLYENLGDGTFVSNEDAGDADGTTLGRSDSVVAADYDRDGFVDLAITNGYGDAPFNDGPVELLRNLGNTNRWLEIDLQGVLSNRDGIGSTVTAVAGAKAQLRAQTGGMHAGSQDHSRVHFGLGQNNDVDRLDILWPSGTVQTIHDLPANQVVQVIEPVVPMLRGAPTDDRPGLRLWKADFDGSYRLRVRGDGSAARYAISVLADAPVTVRSRRWLESDDTVISNGNLLEMSLGGESGKDAVDFWLPSGANALIAVELDGQRNPRQLRIGPAGLSLAPTGWIVAGNELPSLPSFRSGQELGLFFGQQGSPSALSARWNGDGPPGRPHTSTLKLYSSTAIDAVQEVGFEPGDNAVFDRYSMHASGRIDASFDGVDVTLAAPGVVGVSYSQDELPQDRYVNPDSSFLGGPNAYLLPNVSATGRPAFTPGTEEALFLWRSEPGRWSIRAIVADKSLRYLGRVKSSAAISSWSRVRLESNDFVSRPVSTQLDFDLKLLGGAALFDGVDFATEPGATVTLELGDNEVPDAKKVRLGAERWSVRKLPVEVPGD